MGDTLENQDDGATVEAAGVTSFSELLMLSDDVLSSSDHRREDNGGDGGEDSFGFVFSGKNGSRMLCFSGGYQNDDESLILEPSFPSGVSVPDPLCIDACTVDKSSNVRKERLGERIAALQQLVSPYGKTDAASVLHEAMGYIKFLHDQIQVLSSPYLINHHSLLLDGGAVSGDDTPVKKMRDLRSRGLCLVPVSSTLHVENTNGADFWSPAATMGHITSPSVNQGPY
ncbi:unnamed protein product [Arabis nemorensis]|uniref:BHLH domain-containing protein n=1 Tax=Arabis nemorensis TaxID=586526 RepID=A0A565B9E0_9BRAS|nr:unnamed protein product [Arabis nemorensis]